MNINPRNLSLKQDYDRTKWMHLAHFALLLFAFCMEWYYGRTGFLGFVGSVIVLSIFYRLSYQTIKNLYYTFWTFAGILLVYLGSKTFTSFMQDGSPALLYLYGLALIFLIIEMYILSSPLYYPIVNWWEYDFRFRYDLKIKLKERSSEDEDWSEIRLTDLRRGAGCVASFDEYKKGQILELKCPTENKTYHFKVEVMSKRQYSVGRPFHYGVSFMLESDHLKEDYQSFFNYWKRRKQAKRQLKFEKVSLK